MRSGGRAREPRPDATTSGVQPPRCARAEDTGLNQIVARMGSMLKRLLGEGVELAVPTSDTRHNIHADPGQIEQIHHETWSSMLATPCPRGARSRLKRPTSTSTLSTLLCITESRPALREDGGDGHRRGNGRRDEGTYLRPFLHDQDKGQGHWVSGYRPPLVSSRRAMAISA